MNKKEYVDKLLEQPLLLKEFMGKPLRMQTEELMQELSAHFAPLPEWVAEHKPSPEHAPVKIIYNGISTVAIFQDGRKIISRPNKGETFDKETGLAMCIAKHVYGSRSKFLRAVEGANDQNPEQSEDSFATKFLKALELMVEMGKEQT